MDPAAWIAIGMQMFKAGVQIKQLAEQAQAEERDLTSEELDQVKTLRKTSMANLDDAIASRRNSDDSTDGE